VKRGGAIGLKAMCSGVLTPRLEGSAEEEEKRGNERKNKRRSVKLK